MEEKGEGDVSGEVNNKERLKKKMRKIAVVGRKDKEEGGNDGYVKSKNTKSF